MPQLTIPVEEFTTPDPLTIADDQHLDAVRALMDEHGIRHLPVTRGDQVVGIISDRDVRVVLGLNAEQRAQIKASDIMAADPISVPASTPLDRAAFIMSDKKVGSVIVMEDNGSFLGLFTLTDALNALIEIVRGAQT